MLEALDYVSWIYSYSATKTYYVTVESLNPASEIAGFRVLEFKTNGVPKDKFLSIHAQRGDINKIGATGRTNGTERFDSIVIAASCEGIIRNLLRLEADNFVYPPFPR